jgi:hypothetical protein
MEMIDFLKSGIYKFHFEKSVTTSTQKSVTTSTQNSLDWVKKDFIDVQIQNCGNGELSVLDENNTPYTLTLKCYTSNDSESYYNLLIAKDGVQPKIITFYDYIKELDVEVNCKKNDEINKKVEAIDPTQFKTDQINNTPIEPAKTKVDRDQISKLIHSYRMLIGKYIKAPQDKDKKDIYLRSATEIAVKISPLIADINTSYKPIKALIIKHTPITNGGKITTTKDKKYTPTKEKIKTYKGQRVVHLGIRGGKYVIIDKVYIAVSKLPDADKNHKNKKDENKTQKKKEKSTKNTSPSPVNLPSGIPIAPRISLKKLEKIVLQIINHEIKNIKKNNGLSIGTLLLINNDEYIEFRFNGIDPYAYVDGKGLTKVQRDGNFIEIKGGVLNRNNKINFKTDISFEKFKTLEDSLSKNRLVLITKIFSNVTRVDVEWAKLLHQSGSPTYKEKNKYALKLLNEFY